MRRPSTGWHVEVDLPSGRTVSPELLDDPEFPPQLNGLPEISVPVPNRPRWHRSAITGQDMRVWYDGRQLPIGEIEGRDEQADRVVLNGVGGVQLRTYIDNEPINNEYTHEAVRRLIPDRTGYSVDVRQPDAQRYDGNTILQQDATTTNADNLKPLPDDSPVHVNSNDEVELYDSCWFVEGEEVGGNYSSEVTDTDEWSDNGAALLDADNTSVEYTFNTDYSIPQSRTQVSFLAAVPNDTGNNFEAEVRLNGLTYRTLQDEDFDSDDKFDTAWKHTSPASGFNGEETVTFEVTDAIGSDVKIYIDVIAPLDDDYQYTFDTADGTDQFIEGPQTKPDFDRAETVTPNLIQTVVGGRLDVTIDDTSDDQQLGIRNESGDAFTTASNTDSVETDFANRSRQLTGRVTLARYGSRNLPSPTTGFKSQTVSDLTLTADLKPIPALVDEHPRATLLEALQGWADDGDYVWQVRRDQSAAPDDRDGYIVKMARAGQLTGDAPGDVVSYQGSETDREAYERVEVFGSSSRGRATVLSPDNGTKIGVGRDTYHVVGSERVYDAGTDPSPNDPADYERRKDYEYDYNEGAITNLAGSDMSEDDDFVVLYRHNHRGTATVENPSTLSENTFKTEFPTAETESQCELLARQLLRQVDSPGQDLRVTVTLEDPRVDLVQALSFAPINLDGPLQIREARHQPGEVRYRLRRQRVSEIVDRLRSRAAQLAERTE